MCAGEKATLVVAAGGVLRFWDVHKHERAPESERDGERDHELLDKER